ncbi:MAG: RNA pyrophosphohydrolase [Gammaproteobacteria bacterium]
MIDSEGFRANVGIVLSNEAGQVFWAKRLGQDAWQFPQGGIKANESAEDAMYRELREEVGLLPEHIEIVGCTSDWLKYWLPEKFIRQNSLPLCIGQKQIWYLLKLVADETNIDLAYSKKPEFDHWEWIEYWSPASKVIDFKRNVYEQALNEFAPFLFP